MPAEPQGKGKINYTGSGYRIQWIEFTGHTLRYNPSAQTAIENLTTCAYWLSAYSTYKSLLEGGYAPSSGKN
ncbi:hypothetical protein POX_b02390 [Penicillium oxalicum]|uniref:Uncharacterized protein n=1 Tax=Penicillium oxalicum (strain 114-2 / CGMCC 5302) TaxID=933388 RepID=S7ZIY7_PENO1|nr:hypothetical protein POX_b02390 [Penicillium oxalicum]EPS30605.1 hypothetical protein PDE_05557 [Penicillium oxalicum 114-2]KAI2792353.1 hypothetical protein POX_b02390 [Penicillium oxalicum]